MEVGHTPSHADRGMPLSQVAGEPLQPNARPFISFNISKDSVNRHYLPNKKKTR